MMKYRCHCPAPGCFHLLKNLCLFSLLVLKGIYHYWKYSLIFPGVLATWKGGLRVFYKSPQEAAGGRWSSPLETCHVSPFSSALGPSRWNLEVAAYLDPEPCVLWRILPTDVRVLTF